MTTAAGRPTPPSCPVVPATTRPRRATSAARRRPDRHRRQPAAGDPRARAAGRRARAASCGPCSRCCGPRGGTWVGWTGEADDAPEPFTHDGVSLHPVLVDAPRRCRTTTRASPTTRCGRCTTTPCATRRTAAPHWDGLPDGQPALRRHPRRGRPRRGDRVDPRLPPAARARRCCATKRPRPGHRVLLPHPVPAGRAVHAAAVAHRDRRRARRVRPRRLPAGDQRRQLHRRLRRAARAPARASGRTRSRSTSTSSRPSPPAGPPASARTATAPGSASRRSCCSASTASTTRRASASACGRTSRCSTTAPSTPSAA